MLPIIRMFAIAVIPFAVFTFSLSNSAEAQIAISEMRVAGVLGEGTSSGAIETGDTNSNYELLMCGVQAEGQNLFNAPSPGTWVELNNDQCFEPNCQLGIWGRVIDSTLIEEVTCSWAEDSSVFTAVRMSFAGVDTDDPVIDIVCTEYIDGFYVLDNLNSEPNAQFVFVQLIERLGPSSQQFTDFDAQDGRFTSNIKFSDELILSLSGSSRPDFSGKGEEGFSIPPLLEIFNTQSCSLTLRTAGIRPIPTVSEWGLIAMAGILGLLALIVLRRKQRAV